MFGFAHTMGGWMFGFVRVGFCPYGRVDVRICPCGILPV